MAVRLSEGLVVSKGKKEGKKRVRTDLELDASTAGPGRDAFRASMRRSLTGRCCRWRGRDGKGG
jgi:hypothetical protein